MISVLESGSSGPGSSPDRGIKLCSWARHFILIVPLFTAFLFKIRRINILKFISL